jgi:hypothetical protein
MTAEMTYIAVYVLGVSAGIIFAIIAKGVEYEGIPWLQEREDTFKGDLESPSTHHTVTRLRSHLHFGMFKK